ncbi:glutathione S-transferase family protein [Marinovum sp. SP66]|uniref:glutathione S-transferase family protein n=1 Tax=Marinovum TaxID=367771 RepID=UPI00237BBC0E|nr:glutathione S-transferase family protein [Marinovum sp. SP66]MDD9738400.1 glutathione S-transferase family protein [Marinovum sp. SP66]
MYTVIGGVASRTFRVLWMLEELGADYEHRPASPHAEEVTAHSVSGKIPVLLDGDAALTDSTAILTYLADKHGALTYPAGSLERARQDAVTFAVLDELDSLLWTAARHSFVLPEDQRVPAVKESLKAEYARNLARLTDRVAGPFVMGARMTVPDIVLTHCCNWAISAKFPDPDKRLAPYLSRMRARPAFGRARALSKPVG